eukprot:855030-Prorocentrum_minimum.AAC.2
MHNTHNTRFLRAKDWLGTHASASPGGARGREDSVLGRPGGGDLGGHQGSARHSNGLGSHFQYAATSN